MVLCCNITIGALRFNAIADVSIESSWQNFTDTAKVKFPRALYYLRNGKPISIDKTIQELVKTGDKVSIQLGYNRVYAQEFTGYVSRSPRATFPYEIECEDEMWQLKRKKVSISEPNATVRQILETIAPGYEIDCPDEVFGKISMKDTTAVMVLEHLKKTAGLYSFFRNGRLLCGLVYSDSKVTDTVANYAFGQNILNESLQFITSEDIKTIIYASSTAADGSVIRANTGTEGGNVIRRNFPSGFTQKELETKIKRELEQKRVTGGYDGELKSYGFPHVVHGQTVRVKDTIYEERDSQHFADTVKVVFNPEEGYKRILKISSRV
tara:strand:+ start:36747 stop:37718 length:972 start_codon:yes stop_codon:yes gene_type:complete